jgi:hypothetical protein
MHLARDLHKRHPPEFESYTLAPLQVYRENLQPAVIRVVRQRVCPLEKTRGILPGVMAVFWQCVLVDISVPSMSKKLVTGSFGCGIPGGYLRDARYSSTFVQVEKTYCADPINGPG